MNAVKCLLRRKVAVLVAFGLMCWSLNAQQAAQQIIPQLGKICPDYSFHNVEYFNKKSVSISDFKGKWLILDFWSEYCSGCLKSMVKNNKIQKELAGKIQFFSIGWIPDAKNLFSTKAKYETLRKMHHLTLPIVYDSILFNKFGGTVTPYIILIDPAGIVRALTYHLTEEDVKDLVYRSGKPNLNDYPIKGTPKAIRVMGDEEYNLNIPLLVNNNGAGKLKILSRSLITDFPDTLRYNNFVYEAGRFEAIGCPLNDLYWLAFSGFPRVDFDNSIYVEFYPKIIFESKDSSEFWTNNRRGRPPYFCYSLILPDTILNDTEALRFSINKKAQGIMQRDLENYFGFRASVEMREMPYFKIVSNEPALSKIRTKGGNKKWTDIEGTNSGLFLNGIRAQNVPIAMLVQTLWSATDDEITIVNETGYNGNIDITLKALSNDFEGLREELKLQGIDVQPSKKFMKVLVIRNS